MDHLADEQSDASLLCSSASGLPWVTVHLLTAAILYAISLQHHMDETCAWLRCLSLDASTRAATLLAGGAGRTGQQRQARTPAAERREIWRVLQV